jgi:hypothetical protein
VSLAAVCGVLVAGSILGLVACSSHTRTEGPAGGAPSTNRGPTSPAQPSSQKGMPQPGTPGPWDHDVLVFKVHADGVVTGTGVFERAGVPTVTRMEDGTLIAAHQFFPADDPEGFDKVVVRFSADEGDTWRDPQVIRMDGLPQGMRFPFDPALVALPDGRMRLYFTSLHGMALEQDLPAIYSAVSSNGIDYTFEPGIRFSIPGRPVIDCAVVLHRNVFHLYAPDNGTRISTPDPGSDQFVGYHATSVDGLVFTRVADVRIGDTRRWLGSAQSDGQIITFWGTQDNRDLAGTPGARRSGVWLASSTDGSVWELRDAPIIGGADPGAVSARQGGWVVVATGPPRPGTSSEQRSRN